MGILRLTCVRIVTICAIVLAISHECLAGVISVLTHEDHLAVYSPIVFKALSEGDDPAGVRWEFDDGTVTLGLFAEHRFKHPGPHLVLLETMYYASRPNYEVLELTIAPQPVGVDLRVTGVTISDPVPTGNNDGVVSPGEWGTVRVQVTNLGTRPAYGVVGTLFLTPGVKSWLPPEDHDQRIRIGDVGAVQTTLAEQVLTFSPLYHFQAPEGLWFYLLLEDRSEHRSLAALTIPLGERGVKTYQAPFQVEGLLSPNHRHVTIYFRSPHTDELRISVSDHGSPLDPRVEVYLPDGQVLSDTDGGRGDDALIVVSDAPEGPYRLEIFGEGGSVGSYVVNVEAIAPPSEEAPVRITFGQVVTGQLRSIGEEHTYTFSANEGQRIEVLLTDEGGSLDPFLVLRPPGDGGEITDDDGGPDDDALIVVPTAPVTGTYTLVVTNAPGKETTGAFRLVLVGERQEEREIHLDETVDGTIEQAGHRVMYSFLNPEKRWLRFLLDDFNSLAEGATLDPFLKLFNAKRKLVASDDNSGVGDDAILVTRLRAGFVEVSGGPYHTVGLYRLRLEEGDSQAPTLDRGTTATYVFAGEPEVFEVFAHAGSFMYISVTDRGGSLDPILRVIDPKGRQIVLEDNSFSAPEDDAHAFLVTSRTGVYRVEITGAADTFGQAWITFELLDEGPAR